MNATYPDPPQERTFFNGAMQSDSAAPAVTCLPQCAEHIRLTLAYVAGKWMAALLIVLYETDAPVRYAALQRRLAPVTPKELTKQLRLLETSGLVRRDVYPTAPPSVEYSLTAQGRSLYPALQALAAWGARMQGDR